MMAKLFTSICASNFDIYLTELLANAFFSPWALVLKTESDLILILTKKKGEASESKGGESEAICGGRSPLGRGGSGDYNYGHDDHHDGAGALVHPFLLLLLLMMMMMMMMTLINRWEAGAQRPDLTSKISFGQTKAGFHLK